MVIEEIEFYKNHKLALDGRETSDLQKHFETRSSLYRHLGILPSLVKDNKVLEIGPGSGFNSLYTASLEPSHYVLVEGSSKSVENIKTLFSNYPFLEKRIQIEEMMFEDFESPYLFDIVLCESVLHGMTDSLSALRKIATFVDNNGMLVITCIDSVSYFSETVRRLLGQIIIDPEDTMDNKLESLMPVFSSHLATLEGMNRCHEDWIIDNLINLAVNNSLLSIPEAISAISNDFEFYSSSPHFVTDWRWYRNIHGCEKHFNEIAIENYWKNVHNLLDYKRLYTPRKETTNRQLFKLSEEIRQKVIKYEVGRDLRDLKDIRKLLNKIIDNIKNFSKEIANCLKQIEKIIEQYPIDKEAISSNIEFGQLFGRGQQYISLTKRDNPSVAMKVRPLPLDKLV